MNCPYCNFKFAQLVVTAAALPDVAPLLCESCLRVSLLENSIVRKVSKEELFVIKQSPAWNDVINPVRLKILEHRRKAEEAESSSIPPVDRNQRTMTDGSPETADHREIDPQTGQQKGYVVLSAEERARGFVRPVRRTYKHITCGTTTTMSQEIAETYARDPLFYSGTFCVHCREHFPVAQFVWDGSNEQVGS